MVRRISIECIGELWVEDAPNGDYVEFSDYDRLLQKLAKYKAALELCIDKLSDKGEDFTIEKVSSLLE